MGVNSRQARLLDEMTSPLLGDFKEFNEEAYWMSVVAGITFKDIRNSNLMYIVFLDSNGQIERVKNIQEFFDFTWPGELPNFYDFAVKNNAKIALDKNVLNQLLAKPGLGGMERGTVGQ